MPHRRGLRLTNDERIQRELALLLRERRPGLLAQIDMIRDYQHGLASTEQARESAHRLAGTLGLFGFSDLGHEASRLEVDLSSGTMPLDARLDDFVERATALLSD